VGRHAHRVHVVVCLALTFELADPADALFQFFFRVAVGFVDRPGGLTQVVEVALLVRYVREVREAISRRTNARWPGARLSIARGEGSMLLAPEKAAAGDENSPAAFLSQCSSPAPTHS
jgi:hypothetical protein